MAKPPPKLDGVKTALDDLISLEQERLKKEETARLAREQEEKRRRLEEEARRKMEEEMRAKRAEEERLAREKAAREEAEKRQWQNQLEEIRLKKELEMKQRLDEERLRLRHEQQLREIESRGRKGFPRWPVAAVLALLVACGAAAGIVIFKARKDAGRLEKDRIAAIEAGRSKDRQSENQIAQLQKHLAEMEKKLDISKEEASKIKEIKNQIALLQASQAGGGKAGKPGKTEVKPDDGTGKGTQEEFGDGLDPLSGIEKDLGSSKKASKKSKKKKRIKIVNTKGGTLDLEDPLQEL